LKNTLDDEPSSDTANREVRRTPQTLERTEMAFTAETGDHKVSRSDTFMVDPTALVVDWRKNLSRGGEEPPVDEALKQLALDMAPKKGKGDDADGSSGQLNPILVRPLPDRRLEVVGGFRRMRAALWLVESGTCADFKVKYTVSRLSDAESALVNLSENMQREDPKPIQLAHAIRCLTEDYGLSLKQVAARLKRSETWISSLLDLVMLPTAIQSSVAKGKTPVGAALELVKVPPKQRVAVFDSLVGSGEKITAAKVKEKRQAIHEKTGEGGPIPHSMKQLRAFLEGKSGPADHGKKLAVYMLEYLSGKRTDENLSKYWDRAFAERD
jgi:ParB family transcriptional regulator, chromosome partitioning protein